MSSIVHIYRRFPTPESCTAHLERVRWNGVPLCPYCGSEKISTHKEASKSRWQCSWCKKSFSVTVGTIFHNSHIDMQRWFLLIALMFSAKKGLSAMQAARDLEMRRPTVWSMMHRIRSAMKDDGKLLAGIVEMDETYVGGKPPKKCMRQWQYAQINPSPRVSIDGYAITSENEFICHTNTLGKARLIAAAPELLEQLEKQLEWLNHAKEELHGSTSIILGIDQSIRYISAVINKAKGII